ncbi:hypothetical protein Tco_0599908, partial [Tanacetum coccineum]
PLDHCSKGESILTAYLKQHEVHANENKMMMERFIQPTDDPLALVSNASNQQYPTQSSESPQSSNQPSLVDNCQMDTGSTSALRSISSYNRVLKRQKKLRNQISSALTASADVPSSVTDTTDTTSTLQPPRPPLQTYNSSRYLVER